MNTIARHLTRESKQLFELLDAAAERKGHTEPQMAEELCVTFGFLRQVRYGMRPVDTLSVAFIRGCSDYADVTLDQLLKRPGA